MKMRNFASVSFISLCCLCIVNKAFAGPKLIVVLVDGVRWDDLKDPDLKGFRKIAENGVTVPYVVPIYPSLSYPNWYTITTGLYAENHGFVSNHLYDSATNKFYFDSPHPSSLDPLWWNEAEPIWITAEKNNMSTAMYWWGGCNVRIRDQHAMICERERFGPQTPEESEDFVERIEDIVQMFKPSKRFPKDRLSLVLMYYGSTDYAGHFHGTKSAGLKVALLDIDRILDKMQSKLAKAGLKDEVNIMVVSDHGMADARNLKYINLDRFKADIKYQVSRGTESMIVPVEGKAEKLYNDLKKADIKGMRVFKKEEIPSKYHVKNSPRMTPIYLMADKNYYIKQLDSFGDSYLGAHGWDPTVVEDMRTIFLASGPAFKKGYKGEPLNITDLYNMMCSVLQLDPLPNNGSWDKVAPLLKNAANAPTVFSPAHHSISSSSHPIAYINTLVLTALLNVMFVVIRFKYI